MRHAPIRLLLLDIGGVLLTNGWDSVMRRRACETFHLDYENVTRLGGALADLGLECV